MKEIEVVGISAGRKGKITESAIKSVLEKSNLSHSFYSLSNFEILTCDACNGCVEDHQCVKDDKLNEIFNAMKEAKVIIFGAPEYWDGINAKARAFWERICFSSRHNCSFPLNNKLGVIIGVSGDGDSNEAIDDLLTFTNDARIDVIEQVEIQGEYACFTCGYGEQCAVGGYVELYPLNTPITNKRTPDLVNQHPEKNKGKDITNNLNNLGKKLKKIIGEVEE
ncbi:flavodoxin family protein [Halanaerocella petrolearia]